MLVTHGGIEMGQGVHTKMIQVRMQIIGLGRMCACRYVYERESWSVHFLFQNKKDRRL